MNRLLWLFLLSSASLVLFLSWLPNPIISTYGFFPKAVGQWVDADANINIRTAVPFLAMGLMAGCWLVLTRQPWQRWIGFGLGFAGIVFVAEVGQLPLPHRHFDWEDIAWGTTGAFGGMLLGGMITYTITQLLRLQQHQQKVVKLPAE
jgi:hypothetical protein